MHKSQIAAAALLVAALVAAAPAARADQYVQFTFDNVTFQDGTATITGSFDFDTTLYNEGQCFNRVATSACLSNVDIMVQDNGSTVSFTAAGGTNYAGPSDNEDGFAFIGGPNFLGLYVLGTSFSTTSSDALIATASQVDSMMIAEYITGGSLDPGPLSVPGPASLPLFASLLAGFGLLRYRRRPRPAAAA